MDTAASRKRCAETTSSPVTRLLHKALASPPPPLAPTPDRAEAAKHPHKDEEDDDFLQLLPTDFMAAITFLKSQISPVLGLPPVFLRSQLCSMLKDTADVERELDLLRRDNVIRMFRLNTGPDEFALMLTEDYVRSIKQAVSREAQALAPRAPPPPAPSSSSSSSSSTQLRLVDAFCSRVLSRHTDLTISRPHLLHLLASPVAAQQSPHLRAAAGCQGVARGSGSAPGPPTPAAQAAPPLVLPETLPCPDTQISLLMQAAVLSRDPGDDATYWLCAPGLGKVAAAISAGRRELSALLARRRYLELPEQLLLSKTKMRRSPLGAAFHLRDMLGLGLVQRVSTTSGSIIRLVRR